MFSLPTLDVFSFSLDERVCEVDMDAFEGGDQGADASMSLDISDALRAATDDEAECATLAAFSANNVNIGTMEQPESAYCEFFLPSPSPLPLSNMHPPLLHLPCTSSPH